MRLICSYWNVGSFPLQKKTMSIYLPPAFKTESRDRVLLASVDNEKLHIESWGIFSNRLYPIEKYYVSFEDTKCEIWYIIGWQKSRRTKKTKAWNRYEGWGWLPPADSGKRTADRSFRCRVEKTIKRLLNPVSLRRSQVFFYKELEDARSLPW